MKKGWIYVALLAAAIIGMTGCAKGKQTAQGTEQTVAGGQLTVGIIDGEDGYAAKDGEKLVGSEPELASRLGASLNLPVTYVEAADQQELLGLLTDKKADVAFGRLPQPDGDGGDFLASISYGRGGLYLVTLKYRYMDNLAALNDKSVILVSKSVSSNLRVDIDGLSRMEVQDSGSLSDMASAVKGKLCAAAICTEREALAMVGQDPDIQANELLNTPSERYCGYTLKDRPQLMQSLNAVVSAYMDDRAQGKADKPETPVPPAPDGKEAAK